MLLNVVVNETFLTRIGKMMFGVLDEKAQKETNYDPQRSERSPTSLTAFNVGWGEHTTITCGNDMRVQSMGGIFYDITSGKAVSRKDLPKLATMWAIWHADEQAMWAIRARFEKSLGEIDYRYAPPNYIYNIMFSVYCEKENARHLFDLWEIVFARDDILS